MTNDLLFSEILFSIIFIIAATTALEFYKSKNGVLRKLMIAYFIIECFVYLSSGLYFYLFENGVINISIHAFRIFVLLPKAAIMLRLVYYLKNKT